MERVVVSDLTSAGIDYSPQEFSQLAMGCSYNGMEMSVVFVSGAQTWQKSSDSAQQQARYSTQLVVENKGLELMRPVLGPRPWVAVFNIGHAAWACLKRQGQKYCVSRFCVEH
ncbi:hypothetical protein PENARI_c111G03804 [Penicillium arizonense]|uniref:Uncharacterized protein n=1 Tax=Penicillium arizonense TaxID=1835702 RepID=A0A1F5L0N7_PENAI|nr:hypothetical protein PENARI_c111G03804 [Penicillium arizonense]OGE46783.1 hypothetical protein PENARI_c111G03804 [Penicillium arizonense]